MASRKHHNPTIPQIATDDKKANAAMRFATSRNHHREWLCGVLLFALIYFALLSEFPAATGCATEQSTQELYFLTKDGKLIGGLEFVRARKGFVGESGTIWTITPSGTLQVSRFINDRTEAPNKTMQLTDEQLEGLAKVLQQQDFLTLPAQVGQAELANPQRVTISLGGKASTLILDSGQSIRELKAVAKTEPRSSLARLVAIIDMLDSMLSD